MSTLSEPMDDEQYVTAGVAAEALGTTRMKVAALIRSGVLPFERDPLDRRLKLIPLRAVEALRRGRKRTASTTSTTDAA